MSAGIRGLLLCGGASSRFGSNKLLALPPASAGEPGERRPLVVRSARNLIAGAGNALAVIRPGEIALREVLEGAGCDVIESAGSRNGIGESLVAGVAASGAAAGWIVALGDMPFVRPATVGAVVAALQGGALLAAAESAASGERGHPVGFAAALKDELLALRGDTGARAVLQRHRDALVRVPVDDAGIFFDVDTPEQLAQGDWSGGPV